MIIDIMILILNAGVIYMLVLNYKKYSCVQKVIEKEMGFVQQLYKESKKLNEGENIDNT